MQANLKRFFETLADLPTPLRILSFLLVLALLWAPFALPVQWFIPDQNLVSLMTIPILYLLFLGLLQVWRDGRLLKRYGMRRPKAWIYEWLGGLGIGYGVVLLLFEIQGALGWLRWFNPTKPLPWVLLEGFMIAALVALAEEIFFRGWLLDELSRSYKPNTALVATSIIYAVVHGPRLVPASIQWIALVLLGWALGMGKRITDDRLGFSAGIHGGLVWCYYVLNVGQLFQYTNKVPVWVTGFENNSLAGVVGILTMASLALTLTVVHKRQKLNNEKAR